MSAPQPTLCELILQHGRDIDIDDVVRVCDQIPNARTFLRVTYACRTCRRRYFQNIEGLDELARTRCYADIWEAIEAPFYAHKCRLELGPAGRP